MKGAGAGEVHLLVPCLIERVPCTMEGALDVARTLEGALNVVPLERLSSEGLA